MKKRKNFKVLPVVGLVLTILLVSLTTSTALAQPPAKVDVLIAFTNQPGAAEQSLVQKAGGVVKYTYHLAPAIAASVPETALNGLQNNPHVAIVEPDGEVQAIDAELDNAWGVKRIGAGLVHAAGNKGAGVKVGILDTGIDTDHPDLNYDPGCSQSFVSGQSIEDGYGHGTHVAGTIAGLDNDMGVVGVAPEATLCIYKVLNNSGYGSYSDIIAALEQAVDDGVQVTNNSYGSFGDPGSIVRTAFDNAYAAGVLHIASAGNNGNSAGTGDNCGYPARWDSVVATAATTSSDTRASFSSTCPEVELAAPGVSIYSSVPGGGYGYKNGTSMASPHAAGTAALVIAGGLTGNDAVRQRLQESVEDLGQPGRDNWYGFGLINAAEAVNTPPSVDFSFAVDDLTASFTDQSTDADGDIVSWAWDFGDGNSSTAQNPTHTYGAAGSYAVTLTVTDNGGATASVTKDISIIALSAAGYRVKGVYQVALRWGGVAAPTVDIYRNGAVVQTVSNSGSDTDVLGKGNKKGVYTYQICEAGTSVCSNEATVSF